MKNFIVSVIIPVYNCAEYLLQAVESALSQPEVGEVILVEDDSPDNAIEICRNLEKNYSKVKLFQHSDKKNHGAGASRNLGIENAKYEYIAFLDGDDYYLPSRFKIARKVFECHIDADGVYDAAITFTDNKEDLPKNRLGELDKLITFNKKVSPDKLLSYFCTNNKSGGFHTNCVVLKKKIINKVGLFDETLEIGQDTNLWIRLMSLGNLYPGDISKPVAMFRRHNENRCIAGEKKNKYYSILLARKAFYWGIEKKIPLYKKKLILEYYVRTIFATIPSNKNLFYRTNIKVIVLFKLFLKINLLLFIVTLPRLSLLIIGIYREKTQ